MDIAEELAARDMSINIYIRAESVHIALIKADGNWAGKSRFAHWRTNHEFDVIESEIERLLEGCDDNAN